jgi:hypothetical protein
MTPIHSDKLIVPQPTAHVEQEFEPQAYPS